MIKRMKELGKIILSSAYPVYVLLITAHIALVWWLPFFPTQDGPSHLYNLVILKDLLNGGRTWGEFYVSHLSAIPNLGFHVFAYPLLTLFSPAATEKIFITIYILLMVVSVPFFMRSFNKPVFPFSFLVFPVIFNFNLMMGFYSYSVAIPFFLLAFGCCYRYRNTPALKKFIIFNSAGFVIYSMHLIAFGVFILSLAAMALSESGGLKDRLRKTVNLVGIISPLLVNLLAYLLSSNDFRGIPFRFIPWSDRIIDLMTLSAATLASWQIYPSCLLFYIFICCLTFGVGNEVKDDHQGNKLTIFTDNGAQCLLLIVSALLLICLFFPFNLGAGSFFNQRFPWVILLVALPVLHVSVRYIFARYTSSILVSIAVLFLVGNAAAMNQKNATIEEFLGGLSVNIPKGAYIMPYKIEDDYFRVDVLLHAASYYGISKDVFVFGNYEATQDHFPVSFNTSLPKLPDNDQIFYDAETIDWVRFPAIQYLISWKNNDMSNEKISQFFRLIYESGNLAIWQRI
ncbi:MAG: hypothetical protein A2097_12115 [Desulfobacula sp. GWF2_41_7]|nr:MAG: hypothetical protein A2097_12115 [Desulfobacula sp. GWF2_41_7]